MTTISEHRNRAGQLGLRQTSTRSCPRRLARLPHDPESCWCLTRLNDHGRRYLDDTGRAVVMWEPYTADAADLLDVLTHADRDDLAVMVTGWSPWNPGATFALVFTAREGSA